MPSLERKKVDEGREGGKLVKNEKEKRKNLASVSWFIIWDNILREENES